MEVLAPAGAAALLGIPAILLLHLLRARRATVAISSVAFWPRAIQDLESRSRWRRLRFTPILILQLLAASALAIALIRPSISRPGLLTETTIALVDGSPSMLAKDVAPSRLGSALQRLRSLARGMHGGQRLGVVLMGRTPRLLMGPTDDGSQIERALSQPLPAGSRGDLSQGLSLAGALLKGRSGGSIVVFTDGHAGAATPPRTAFPVTYVRLGHSGENLGVEGITRSSQGQVVVSVENFGSKRRQAALEMRSDGRLVDVLPVALDAGSRSDVVWGRMPAQTQILEARLAPHDAFPLDDAGWLLVPPASPRRVLLVSPGNGFLARALSLYPGIVITAEQPTAYSPGGSFDLFVFDRFVPAGPLPGPAVLIAPPAGQGPVPAGALIDPGEVLPPDPAEPLLRNVNLGDVHVAAAPALKPSPDWRTVIRGLNGPLLIVSRSEQRVAEIGFDLHDSDLPLRPAFPILIHNLMAQLLPGGFESHVYSLGETVPVEPEPGARSLEITTPGGTLVRLAPPFPPAPFADTWEPGVYTVHQRLAEGERLSRFVAALGDRSSSRIAPADPPAILAGAPRPGSSPAGSTQLWPALAMIALAGVIAEWMVFLRQGG